MSPSPSRRLRILIALVSAFTIVFGPAMSLVGIGLQQAVAGTATVDGRVTAGDGYVKFADIHVDGDAVATVWWTRDDDFVYFALELNALAEENVVNENVYAEKGTGGGFDYHSAYETGWGNHNFGHLENSDAARFQIACNGVVKDDFIHDYLYETTSGYASGPGGPDGEIFTNGPIATSSSMVWNSTVGWADFETQSPDFDSKYPTPAASTPADWVWEMTYEFKLNAANYQGCLVSFAMPPFSGDTGEIGGMHNSPAKEGGESIIVTPIPEPTEPDLSITKSASVDEITVGGSYTYLLTVTNGGDGDATNVTVTDDLDDDLSFGLDDITVLPSGSCSIGAGNTISCDLGTLAAEGGQATISIEVTATVAACGDVTNQATADAGNNGEATSALVTVTILCPDVSVLKTADEDSINAGDEAGYQVVVSAGGTGNSENVELTDQLPDGITWTAQIVDPDGDDTCSISVSNLLECSFGSMAAGSSKTVNVSGTALPGSCPEIENSASVSADVDVDTENNDVGPVVMAVNCPDVKVTKSGSGTVNATDAIWFELLVENIGDGDAYDFELTDTLPAVEGGWSEGSGFPSFCDLTGNSLSCELEVFESADDFTVRVEATSTVDDCGELPNTASVLAENEHADDTENNESNATIDVECPGLTAEKTADDDVVTAGQPIGFGITVTNADEADTGVAYDVEIVDPLPAGEGIDWEIDSDPDEACEITGSVGAEVLECDFGDLDPGESVSVHVSSDTTAASCERYENVASITSDNHETLEPEADTLVQCPGLNMVKVADDDDVVAGETTSFLMKIWNTGPGDALDVVWTDQTPAGLSWTVEVVQGSVTSCIGAATSEGESWQCELGNLSAAEDADDDEAVHIRITAETTADDCGDLENVAFADASNDDQVSSGDTITVRCPRLAIDKVADAEVVTITTTDGEVTDIDPEVVTWTLTYTLTDGPVTGAVITDEVPDFLTYVDGSASDGGVYDEATRTITWSLGTLTGGGVVTFQTTVDADAPEGPAIENVVVIDSNETEPDDGRDSITVVGQEVSGPTPTPKPTTPPDTATAAEPSGAPVQLPLAVLVILFAGSLGAFATASIRVARRQG